MINRLRCPIERRNWTRVCRKNMENYELSNIVAEIDERLELLQRDVAI